MGATHQFSLERDEKDCIDSRIMAARVAHNIIEREGPSKHLPESFPGSALALAAKSLSRMKARQTELGLDDEVIDRSELKIKLAVEEIHQKTAENLT